MFRLQYSFPKVSSTSSMKINTLDDPIQNILTVMILLPWEDIKTDICLGYVISQVSYTPYSCKQEQVCPGMIKTVQAAVPEPAKICMWQKYK